MNRISYGKHQTDPPESPETADSVQIVAKLKSRLGDLDTIPFVYRKLLSLLNSPFVSARDLGKVISTDQSLSIRVLRMVNSAYYGVTTRVMSVTQAVSMLGLNVVRSLCFCLASYDSFFTGTGSEQTKLWGRSMGTGLTAKNLSRMANLRCPEELFVAGMLYDVGNSVLRKFAPREHAALMAKLRDAEDPLAVERAYLGTDRAEIGALVCQTWKLPDLLVACVKHMHHPEEAGQYKHAAVLVSLARQGWINHQEGTNEWNEDHLKMVSLQPQEIFEAVQVAETEFLELGSYVGLKSRAS